ncbi:hypothetical protein BV898_01672 [Hypsibius exemplaris]|uniref:BMERB domain-containing protein n=1 Tax=Hypsibius exemplaris TaxID=2072580 RepID=A0A1W0XBC5_HYPEX|nr:hypothetical protein BV898_01672 [Hypsibius exemplaris]
MTTSKKVYPDQLNPFGEDEDDDDANNPFKSDDDEEVLTVSKSSAANETLRNIPSSNGISTSSGSHLSPVNRKSIPGVDADRNLVAVAGSNVARQTIPTPRGTSSTSVQFPGSLSSAPSVNSVSVAAKSNPAVVVVDVGVSATSESDVSRPPSKPSPLPRRSLLVHQQQPEAEIPQSPAEFRLPVSPLPPRADGSTTPVKRRAPSIPLSTEGLTMRPLPSPEKSPIAGLKKKLAPPPPPCGMKNGEDQRRKSSADIDAKTMEERFKDLEMSPGKSTSSLTTRRDSGASASSCLPVGSLTPDRSSMSQHLASSVEDLEEQQYMDLMQALKDEHQAIEAELRELMSIPNKLRSAAQIAREQRLINDLMENVKRRDELEDEEEDHDFQRTLGDAGSPGTAPKKMKKKRKFKIKNFLGVK